MFYIGLDLAWGTKNPTGIAVLDRAGRLVHLSAAVSDDDIVDALTPYVAEECRVAIDAPLVVTNPSGRRRAEAELSRDFARFDAGTHPTNTAKPEFKDGARGARLSARLGIAIDPDSASSKRAIEVYPHPASVVLFRLAKTLKYKQKRDRTLALVREELLRLTRLLEGLALAEPALHLADHDAWRHLVSSLKVAERKADVRRLEDQVDAVLCAYVALYADRRPTDVTTYGNLREGYIVTPTLRPDFEPLPQHRDPNDSDDPNAVVGDAVREYAAIQPTLQVAAAQATDLVRSVLDEAGINYLSVVGRAKSVASFAAKSIRTANGERLYSDPLAQIGDTVGVRVVTFVHSDVATVVALLGEEFVVHDDRDLGQETASEGGFGYASRHLQIGLTEEDRLAHPVIGERQIQVQIRTTLQHAWAEFEHDIRYKGSIPTEQRAEFDRRFTLAAGLLELADRELSAIHERVRAGLASQPSPDRGDDPRISSEELSAFLAGQYADAAWSRGDHYTWISGLILELGITSLAELAAVIRSVDAESLASKMGYRHASGAVRRLDDVLLAAFGDRYVTLHGNAHRIERLRTRLAKLSA